MQIAMRITRRGRDMVKKLPMNTGRFEIALNGLLLFEIMLKVNLLLILLLIRETKKVKSWKHPISPTTVLIGPQLEEFVQCMTQPNTFY